MLGPIIGYDNYAIIFEHFSKPSIPLFIAHVLEKLFVNPILTPDHPFEMQQNLVLLFFKLFFGAHLGSIRSLKRSTRLLLLRIFIEDFATISVFYLSINELMD